jgi:putative SOS response-associated peptidase YedK
MCGRYTLTDPGDVVADLFGLDSLPELAPRYNIAPTQDAPVVRAREEAADGRRLDLLRWGLVPFWAKDPSIGNRLINARSETAADKPSFRDGFKKRRCLVVTDGFYEWKKEGGAKQPYWIHFPDRRPFAFAGLWSRWDGSKERAVDQPLETFTILTRDAHPDIADVHPRMPVILAPDDYAPWLDPGLTDKADVRSIVERSTGDGLALRRVSRRVNNPANDVPEVLQEMAD